MLGIKQFLEEIKASPYETIEVKAPHTGVIELSGLKPGEKVIGISGNFQEKPGTLLAHLTREKNRKPIFASERGEIMEVRTELEGKFVEAGDTLITMRHYLSKKEVIELILKKALHLFLAPERGKYYFIPEIDQKFKVSGKRSVKVREGMELFIVSRMKRETLLAYSGPEGITYSVYFHRGDNVDAGKALIGVCPEEELVLIQDMVTKVQSDWEEPE